MGDIQQASLLGNFKLQSSIPNFERDRIASKEEMRLIINSPEIIDYGHICFCLEDGKYYKYTYDPTGQYSNNICDDITGYFKELNLNEITVKTEEASYAEVSDIINGLKQCSVQYAYLNIYHRLVDDNDKYEDIDYNLVSVPNSSWNNYGINNLINNYTRLKFKSCKIGDITYDNPEDKFSITKPETLDVTISYSPIISDTTSTSYMVEAGYTTVVE